MQKIGIKTREALERARGAEREAKEAAAERTGELIMDVVRRDVRPSSIVTRTALENGIASIAATGGSTNGVLHILALAQIDEQPQVGDGAR